MIAHAGVSNESKEIHRRQIANIILAAEIRAIAPKPNSLLRNR